jgi:purine-binding chemotaxis protein CheW
LLKNGHLEALREARVQFLGPATRRSRQQQATAPTESFLLFRVGEETYGMGLQGIREVLEPTESEASLPGAYRVCAVLSHRDRRIPVIRMRALFDVTPDEPSATARVLVMHEGGRTVGLLVDEVLGMAEVDPQRVSPLPAIATLLDPALFRGVVARQDRLVVLVSERGLAEFEEVGAFYAGSA